jgi:hypothetical protein
MKATIKLRRTVKEDAEIVSSVEGKELGFCRRR